MTAPPRRLWLECRSTLLPAWYLADFGADGDAYPVSWVQAVGLRLCYGFNQLDVAALSDASVRSQLAREAQRGLLTLLAALACAALCLQTLVLCALVLSL